MRWAVFRILDRWAPRFLTDACVLRGMNIPMKLGAGEAAVYRDFRALARECTTYQGRDLIASYVRDGESTFISDLDAWPAEDPTDPLRRGGRAVSRGGPS